MRPANLENRQMQLRALFRDILERMYRFAARKPQFVYDVRAQKATTPFERMLSDYRRRLSEGADKCALLDGHELVALEVESLTQDERSSIVGRAYLTLEESHRREFEVECQANTLQLAVRDRRDLPTLYAARDASLTELTTLKQFIRALDREIAAKESLAKHVGYARPMKIS